MDKVAVIYIHGFKSTGYSKKAMQLKAALDALGVSPSSAERLTSSPAEKFTSSPAKAGDPLFLSPTLPNHIHDSIETLEQLIKQYPYNQIRLVGSSLGAFYAIHLAEHFNVKAVLINPVIYPWKGFDALIGEHIHPVTGECFAITEEDLASLAQYAITRPRDPSRFLLCLQEDDDMLDYREAIAYLPDAPRIVRTGGGHLFTDFETIIPEVVRFLYDKKTNL